MQKIFIGSDHGGHNLKAEVCEHLLLKNYEVIDLGCDNLESCDYPKFGEKVGEEVIAHPGSLGIVVCGSGIGISIAVNKVKGIRCALANSKELAKLGREHNGANVLAMGERTQFADDPLEIVDVFLDTEVDDAERHKRRRSMLDKM